MAIPGSQRKENRYMQRGASQARELGQRLQDEIASRTVDGRRLAVLDVGKALGMGEGHSLYPILKNSYGLKVEVVYAILDYLKLDAGEFFRSLHPVELSSHREGKELDRLLDEVETTLLRQLEDVRRLRKAPSRR